MVNIQEPSFWSTGGGIDGLGMDKYAGAQFLRPRARYVLGKHTEAPFLIPQARNGLGNKQEPSSVYLRQDMG